MSTRLKQLQSDLTTQSDLKIYFIFFRGLLGPFKGRERVSLYEHEGSHHIIKKVGFTPHFLNSSRLCQMIHIFMKFHVIFDTYLSSNLL